MTIYLYHLLDTLGIIRYVGLTQHINTRKNRHRREKPSHTMEIIQTHQYARLAGEAEQHHIAHHNTFKDGWNGTEGGEGYIPEIGWGVKDISGENNPNWKGGISNDPKLWQKEYDAKRYQTPEGIAKRREYQREYSQTPKRKEYEEEYHQRPENKAHKKDYDKKYYQRPEVKERRKEYGKEYRQRPEVIKRRKEYHGRKRTNT